MRRALPGFTWLAVIGLLLFGGGVCSYLVNSRSDTVVFGPTPNLSDDQEILGDVNRHNGTKHNIPAAIRAWSFFKQMKSCSSMVGWIFMRRKRVFSSHDFTARKDVSAVESHTDQMHHLKPVKQKNDQSEWSCSGDEHLIFLQRMKAKPVALSVAGCFSSLLSHKAQRSAFFILWKATPSIPTGTRSPGETWDNSR